MNAYICIPEEYEVDGEKKVSWKRLGEVFTSKKGKTYMKLYHMPGQLLHIYEKEKKQQHTKNEPTAIFEEEIPF